MGIVADAIVQAIRAGAPIYNKGDVGGCYNVYQETAMLLVKVPECKAEEVTVLTKALSEAAQLSAAGNADGAAWCMRRAFDSVLDGSAVAQARVISIPAGAEDYMVLDFTQGMPSNSPRWYVMDDVIMGGVSSSTLKYDPEEQAAVFLGNVTTDSNGGFASVRSEAWGGWAFGQSKGVRIMVKGDGRTYKLNAKGDDSYDGVQYQRDFAPQAGQWQVVDLPWDSFKPNLRGQMIPNRPPIRGQQVRQVGLMVSKFSDAGGLTQGYRNGNFRLAVRWMKGFL